MGPQATCTLLHLRERKNADPGGQPMQIDKKPETPRELSELRADCRSLGCKRHRDRGRGNHVHLALDKIGDK
jgi:hypothetical protein